MISKVTKDVFNESAGNRLLQAELEKNHRIKTYFNENDKTPNTDGYFEVLDDKGIAIKRFVVQIKTVREMTRLKNGDFSYAADTAFFQYILENIDQNPAVFFVVDLSEHGLYYKYLSLEYLLSLSIGNKRTAALHLNDSDILGEEKFYWFCMSLIRRRVADETSALTWALLPSSNELFQYEHIGNADITMPYPVSVGVEDSKILRIPTTILDKYHDIRLLGTGGTSKVFLLTSKLTGSKVALKVMTIKDFSAKPLLHSFKLIDRLRHPAVPRVLDYFSDGMTEYMIMDYIVGHTLQDLADWGALNLAEIIAIIAELCDVVQYLHCHGIIHRDIKPSNIMVEHSHSIKLIDFDTAIEVNEKQPQYSFIGTMRYASPEIFFQDYRSKVPSDIFSIGATLYYSLVNKETCKFLKMQDTPVDLCVYIAKYTGNELGYGLGILKKALDFDPEKRYESALNIKTELMIWQKKELFRPSALNLALARNRKNYYKETFHKKDHKGK